MSQSPSKETNTPGQGYVDAWQDLATRIRNGNSFSGREPNSAFLNTRGVRFADVSLMSGLGLPDDGRALAVTDWDRDGDLDLWVTNRTAPRIRLLLNHYQPSVSTLALYLEGDPSKGTPRDAIGAVVTVTLPDQSRLTRQVTAGDGFLSQSSKWLHFGLGTHSKVDSVTVRWPGQQTADRFPAMNAGRWHLKQGVTKATRDEGKAVTITSASLSLPSSSAEMETVLTEPQDAPALSYRTWSGDQAKVNTQPLTLTLLWAAWCQPCLGEMALLTEQKALLEKAGIQVIALNIEEAQATIEGSDPPNLETLQQVLTKMGWPFASGRASRDLVETLDRAQRAVLYKQEALPLPSSFLWYRGGLVSFAKGAVSLESLVAQATRLAKPATPQPEHAVPFAGRWSLGQFVTHPVAIAQVMTEGGYHQDARSYLEKSLGNLKAENAAQRRQQEADIQHMIGETYRLENAAPSVALPFYEGALALHPKHPQAALSCARALTALRRGPEALTVLQTFLNHSPDRLDASLQLGNVYQSLGRDQEAAVAYEKVLNVKPEDYEALNQLCWVLSTSKTPAFRNPQRALTLVREILNRYANNAQALDTAATALASAGQYEKAVELTQRAIHLATRSRGSKQLLAEMQARLQLYQQGKAFVR